MFTTERLVFRALDKDKDLKQLIFWMNDPEAQTYMHVGPVMPIDSDGDFLNSLFKPDDRGGLPAFAICLKPTDRLTSENYFDELKIVGNVGLRPSSENIKQLYKNRHVTFGIFLDESLRGQGYGQEVLGFVMKYVFEDLGMHRLALNVMSSNERAQKAYLKAGFTLEGRRRETHRTPDGTWHDTLDMAILEEEYRALGRA